MQKVKRKKTTGKKRRPRCLILPFIAKALSSHDVLENIPIEDIIAEGETETKEIGTG